MADKVYKRKLRDMIPDNKNANRGTVRGLAMLDDSLREDGAGRGILLDKQGNVIAGNKTIERAIDLGFDEILVVPTNGKQLVATQRIDVEIDSPQGRRMAIRDNRISEVDLSWDPAALQSLLDDGVDLARFFGDDELAALLADSDDGTPPGDSVTPAVARKTLAERFIVPPFSVLDARQGYWQERKRAWIALGIQSEIGRGNNNLGMAHPETTSTIDFYAQKRKLEAELGRELTKDETAAILRDRGDLRDDRTANAQRIKGRVPAAIGGHPMPLDRTKNGKGLARAFAQDLMHGEHVVGEKPEPASVKGGLTWVTGAPRKDEASAKNLRAGRKPNGKLQAGTYHAGATPNDDVSRKILAANPGAARAFTSREWVNEHDIQGNAGNQSGTSIFDPVLCELAYRWFCPPDGLTLDPFAGGSVRGIVATQVGRRYIGIDLRPEQIAANEAQAKAITPGDAPRWITGDSRKLPELVSDPVDFVFSCPPYFDLEIYSDDSADLSNAGDYATFLADYRAIIGGCVGLLKADRFACFVVGDIRDKRGMYRNFVSDTIAAFQDAGALLYNEAILVTSVGSLPIRVGKQFESGRKLGKTHQNVLVFIKGDPRKAVKTCGAVDVFVPEELTDESGTSGEADFATL